MFICLCFSFLPSNSEVGVQESTCIKFQEFRTLSTYIILDVDKQKRLSIAFTAKFYN